MRSISFNEKLKPCPFCGGEPFIVVEEYLEFYRTIHIECPNCGVTTQKHNLGIIGVSKDDAFNDWNVRYEG